MSQPPNQENPYSSPAKSTPQQYPADQQGDATGGLIPYKNVPALIGYYLGVAALIPCIGIPFGIAAIVLGILGLQKKKREPHVKGTAHAIVAIVLGLFSVIVYGGIGIVTLVGMSSIR